MPRRRQPRTPRPCPRPSELTCCLPRALAPTGAKLLNGITAPCSHVTLCWKAAMLGCASTAAFVRVVAGIATRRRQYRCCLVVSTVKTGSLPLSLCSVHSACDRRVLPTEIASRVSVLHRMPSRWRRETLRDICTSAEQLLISEIAPHLHLRLRGVCRTKLSSEQSVMPASLFCTPTGRYQTGVDHPMHVSFDSFCCRLWMRSALSGPAVCASPNHDAEI